MSAANIMHAFGDVSNIFKTHQKKSGGQHAQILEQPQRQPWTASPVSNCKINHEKGNCEGDCPEPGESCVHYQMLQGVDLWPNQKAYKDNDTNTSWKCNCMTSQADGIDEKKLETNITRDDLELLTVLDFDGKLDNLFQKEITNEMKTTFQRLAKGDPDSTAYSNTDCAFNVLNYLKLVPREDLIRLAEASNEWKQISGCSDGDFLKILRFFHRNRDNIFYEYLNLTPYFSPKDILETVHENKSLKEVMELIGKAMKNNHATVLFVYHELSKMRHVQILEKTDGGVLRLVDPQHNTVVEGLDNILDSFKSKNIVPHIILLQYHIPKSFEITSHWTKRLFDPSEPPHNKKNFRFVSDDERKEYKEFLERPKYRFSNVFPGGNIT